MGCQSGCTIADEYLYPTVLFSLRMVSQRQNKTKIGVVLPLVIVGKCQVPQMAQTAQRFGNRILFIFQSMIALVPPTDGVRSSCPAFDVDAHRTSRITHHAISTALLDGQLASLSSNSTPAPFAQASF